MEQFRAKIDEVEIRKQRVTATMPAMSAAAPAIDLQRDGNSVPRYWEA